MVPCEMHGRGMHNVPSETPSFPCCYPRKRSRSSEVVRLVFLAFFVGFPFGRAGLAAPGERMPAFFPSFVRASKPRCRLHSNKNAEPCLLLSCMAINVVSTNEVEQFSTPLSSAYRSRLLSAGLSSFGIETEVLTMSLALLAITETNKRIHNIIQS